MSVCFHVKIPKNHKTDESDKEIHIGFSLSQKICGTYL